MSSFVASASTPLLMASDGRLVAEEYADDGPSTGVYGYPFTLSDVLEIDDYVTPWWPGGYAGLVAESGLSDSVRVGVYYQRVYPVSGANGRLAFVGVTRDQYGSPLGGCTVRCYRVLTSELVSIVLSDANGAYTATTPYYEAHFLVVHLSGSPGVAGASTDTLFPS